MSETLSRQKQCNWLPLHGSCSLCNCRDPASDLMPSRRAKCGLNRAPFNLGVIKSGFPRSPLVSRISDFMVHEMCKSPDKLTMVIRVLRFRCPINFHDAMDSRYAYPLIPRMIVRRGGTDTAYLFHPISTSSDSYGAIT